MNRVPTGKEYEFLTVNEMLDFLTEDNLSDFLLDFNIMLEGAIKARNLVKTTSALLGHEFSKEDLELQSMTWIDDGIHDGSKSEIIITD